MVWARRQATGSNGSQQNKYERWAEDARLRPLSHQAYWLAEHMSRVADPMLQLTTRERALERLKESLGWLRAQVIATARGTRRTCYPAGNHRDWLIALDWLSSDRTSERLPELATLPRMVVTASGRPADEMGVGSSGGTGGNSGAAANAGDDEEVPF